MRWTLQAGLLLSLAALALYLLAAPPHLQPLLLRGTPAGPHAPHAAAAGDSFVVPGLTTPGASGPRGIVWVPTDSLLDLNTSAFRPAPGCPPLPAQCHLQDVFDEVVVLSLPRFPQRARRIAAQLNALGTPFTMVHARDKRTGDVAGFAKELMVKDHGSPGALGLLLSHLAILRYITAGPFSNFLILEDDVTFAADFPQAFDAAARALPRDWVTAWLGWIAQRRSDVPAPPQPGALWAVPLWHGQSCAVGIAREAASLLYDALLYFKETIDQLPYRRLQETFPTRVWAAYPPVVAAMPYTESTMGHGWPHSGTDYRAANLVERARFDLWGGGYAGPGRAPRAGACLPMEEGVDYFGEDVRGGGFPRVGEPAIDAPVAAASPRECCAACQEDWPRCHFFTFDASAELCYRKYSSRGRVEAGKELVSGGVESGWEAGGG